MTLLQISNLKKHFPIRSGLLLRQTGTVHAVDGVNLSMKSGETLGLVGESGCGKSTLGRTVIKIYEPTAGSINFAGQNIAQLKGKPLKAIRRNMQMIFQDPFSSLNPRITINTILRRPLDIHEIGTAKERQKTVEQMIERVGLGRWALNRYPHEFSGGQRQRIAIARAIALKPHLVIADEPVSALDVSVQSQILNLMRDIQNEMKMGYLFIAHDLAVVKHMSDTIAVMYLGKIVEHASKRQLFHAPTHPYTQALMVANPVAGRGRKRRHALLKGDVPSPVHPPKGCHFHPRCSFAQDICRSKRPTLKNLGSDADPHLVSCHLAETLPKWNPKEANA